MGEEKEGTGQECAWREWEGGSRGKESVSNDDLKERSDKRERTHAWQRR
jgi:hypothetical protein